MKITNFSIVSFLIFLFTVPCYALNGYELAKKVHDRYIGDNSKAIMYMFLIDKNGNIRKRKFLNLYMEKDKIRKNFIRFLEPEDIAGTGFLSIEDKEGKTIQYLYLPALRRVRRIVSSQKGSSFVNSDFTYEDMERRRVDEFVHKIVGSTKIGKYNCIILESTPKPGTRTEYSLIRSYIPRGIFLSIKTEFYNKHNKLFKVLLIKKLEKIQGIWTPLKIVMKNLKRKHETDLEVANVKYNISEITDDVFTKRSLENW